MKTTALPVLGKLPSSWRIARLGELGEINRGRSRHRPRYAEHLYGGPYPFIQTGDVKASHGRITKYEQTYSEAGLAQSRLWPAGTMCITIAANIAETGILSFPACFPDSIVGFIADPEKSDVHFVEYVFRYVRRRIQHEATGSVQDNINLETLNRLHFHVPPLSEQKAIAHILGALDDKIELNRRMNETLEATARAIFKSWFVDFDPVRAKAEGRAPPGLDPATAALFPDSFEDSPLGEIPAGWGVGKVEELLVLSRDSVSPGKTPDEVFDHYSIPAFDEGCWPKAEPGSEIKSNKNLVPEGAVLLSKLNPRIPRVWMPACRSRRRAIASTEYLVALPRGCATREHLYSLFRSRAFMDVFATLITGTSGSHQRVKPEYLLNMEVVVPPAPVVAHFTVLAAPVHDRVAANLEEFRTLAAIRDALLPKLLSGELRVKDAGSFAGRTPR